MTMVFWLVAVVLAIVGVVQLFQGQLLWAVILFIAAAAIGPGGWSITRGRKTS